MAETWPALLATLGILALGIGVSCICIHVDRLINKK